MLPGVYPILCAPYPQQDNRFISRSAQPGAFVSLGRATDEAGPLVPLVRKCIDEKLKLKTGVLSLSIRSDGFLGGGEVGDNDVLVGTRSKANSLLDVIVGSDGNPTLSFTSGSDSVKPGYLDTLRDAIPAGKGLHNGRMLIGDQRDNKSICGVGEVGRDLYLSSWPCQNG